LNDLTVCTKKNDAKIQYVFYEHAFVEQLHHKLGFFRELEGFFRRSGRLLLKSVGFAHTGVGMSLIELLRLALGFGFGVVLMDSK